MQTNLIQQYIGKVSALCQPEEKEEIEQMLTDFIVSKVKDGGNEEVGFQAVLDQCGSPEIMAELLKSKRKDCLLSGKYYRKFCKVLKIALCIMTFLMIISSVINIIVKKETGFDAVWDVIGSLWSGNSVAFTTVALFFAWLQKKGR